MTTLADKPWLASYDPHVPHNIEIPAITVPVLLADDIPTAAQAIANALHATGFQTGDRAAVIMPDIPAFTEIAVGIVVGGGTVLPIDPQATPENWLEQINTNHCETLFIHWQQYDNGLRRIGSRTRLKRVIVVNLPLRPLSRWEAFRARFRRRPDLYGIDIHYSDLLKLGEKAPRPRVSLSAENEALIINDTTLQHTHLVARVALMQAWHYEWLDPLPTLFPHPSQQQLPTHWTHAQPTVGHPALGSIGLPLPNVECKITDAERELGVGEIGDLWVKSPTVSGDDWIQVGISAECDAHGYFYLHS